ncbi:hypothetical protein BSLG_000237 [Batrachochytrium salamandrivorans]|nr:hypothetical protein BSLG_000237 [Batrachochytrium salamandrivorans]
MSPPTAHKAFRLALIQMQVTANKAANLAHARSMVQAASRSGAQVVVLPECFNSPYAHLFDIDVPGGICFKESEVLTAGDSISMVDTEYGRIGVGICCDMRFPEMAMVAARREGLVDPMGGSYTIDESESIVYADVDPAVVSATRQAIPVYSQRRFDLYPDVADKAVGKE